MKAADGDAAGHLLPAVLGKERVEDGFESDAVKWIAGMLGRVGHGQELVESEGLSGGESWAGVRFWVASLRAISEMLIALLGRDDAERRLRAGEGPAVIHGVDLGCGPREGARGGDAGEDGVGVEAGGYIVEVEVGGAVAELGV